MCAFARRSLLATVRFAEANPFDRYDHLPCSTQLTGSLKVDLAATSTVRLTTRFCLAPINSSCRVTTS